MPTDEKVNLAEKLALFDESFRPKIIGTMNDYKLQVVKVRGEFVWHSHEETDDFFLVLNGQLTIQLRDRDVELFPGELSSSCRAASNTAPGLRTRPTSSDRTHWDHQHRRDEERPDGQRGDDLRRQAPSQGQRRSAP
jgi:hypothetical protein